MTDDRRFDDLIQAEAAASHLPPLLVKAVVHAESGFNPQARSGVGALGLMQLMPGTARDLGFSGPLEDLLEPEFNVRLGCEYLSEQFDHFPEIPDNGLQRWKFACAAYNAGRGHINSALREARRREFGSGSFPARAGVWQEWEFTKTLLHHFTGERSKETLDYVDRIVAYYYWYERRGDLRDVA